MIKGLMSLLMVGISFMPAYASHIQSDLDLWISCVCTQLICTCIQADGDIDVMAVPPRDPSLPPDNDPWVICGWTEATGERCYARGERLLPEPPEQLPPP